MLDVCSASLKDPFEFYLLSVEWLTVSMVTNKGLMQWTVRGAAVPVEKLSSCAFARTRQVPLCDCSRGLSRR